MSINFEFFAEEENRLQDELAELDYQKAKIERMLLITDAKIQVKLNQIIRQTHFRELCEKGLIDEAFEGNY